MRNRSSNEPPNPCMYLVSVGLVLSFRAVQVAVRISERVTLCSVSVLTPSFSTEHFLILKESGLKFYTDLTLRVVQPCNGYTCAVSHIK